MKEAYASMPSTSSDGNDLNTLTAQFPSRWDEARDLIQEMSMRTPTKSRRVVGAESAHMEELADLYHYEIIWKLCALLDLCRVNAVGGDRNGQAVVSVVHLAHRYFQRVLEKSGEVTS
jgi:hypothetical protein